jgi:hypothetical protein
MPNIQSRYNVKKHSTFRIEGHLANDQRPTANDLLADDQRPTTNE